jgi:DNA-binding Lrp family transcriptional regulator
MTEVLRVKMNAKAKVPKANTPRQMSAKLKKSAYTIRIVTEPWGEYRFGLNAWLPQIKTTKPVASIGYALPSTFEVTGLSHRYEFVVDRVRISAKVSRFAITEFRIYPNKEGGAIENLERLQLDSFLAKAVELATLQCVSYPNGYEGVVYANAELTEVELNTLLRTDENELHSSIIGWKAKATSQEVRGVLGEAAPPRRNAVDQKTLRMVANVYKKASPRTKYRAVAEALNTSEHNAKKLVKKARDKGYLPPAEKKGATK